MHGEQERHWEAASFREVIFEGTKSAKDECRILIAKQGREGSKGGIEEDSKLLCYVEKTMWQFSPLKQVSIPENNGLGSKSVISEKYILSTFESVHTVHHTVCGQS